MTLHQALVAATQSLSASPHLAPDARRDAELLLLHAAGIPRATLLAHPTRELSSEQFSHLQVLVARRLAHEPIQYILGHQEFYGLSFEVSPPVLIPRPETELLVESVLQRLPADRPLRIADVGTGSGAIAISLAIHLPQARITALDLSPSALEVARRNAHRHGVSSRIRFLLSDLFATLPSEQDSQDIADPSFDAIVSNPPYVALADIETLHPQVRDHEPHLALFSGPTGLDIYRSLIPQAFTHLLPGGLLALEFGHGQQPALAALLAGWRQVEFLPDLQSIPRVAVALRP